MIDPFSAGDFESIPHCRGSGDHRFSSSSFVDVSRHDIGGLPIKAFPAH